MAGDWIKMRTDLLTSPKVVRMASALNADRFRIAGGLLSVWSLFDAHSVDGILHGYSASTVDELAAWPGFADSMIAVGWLECDGASLAMPRFDSHNGTSAKRRAQDADRKREGRKTSASDADKNGTREEKRREEKKEDQKISEPDKPALNKSGSKGSQKVNESLGAMMEILPGLSEQAASEYLAFRKAKKAPLTPGAWKKIASEIVKSGLPPDDALNTAMARGWQGFDASWLSGASGSGGRGLSKQEAIEAANQRVVDQMVAEEQARKLGYSAQPDIDLGGAIVIDGEVIHAD